MQYQLMKYIASSAKCVSIVGDPDQSSDCLSSWYASYDADTPAVYGWRSAEVENLARMQKGER